MAGNHGTSAVEISAVVGLVPLAKFIYCTLRSWSAQTALGHASRSEAASNEEQPHSASKGRRHSPVVLLAEFAVILLPEIGAMMGVASPHALHWAAFAAAIMLCIRMLRQLSRNPSQAQRHCARVAERLAEKRTE